MASEHTKAIWRRAAKKYAANHPDRIREKNRRNKIRYFEEQRCGMCAAPLLETEVKTCLNCSGRNLKEFVYAANCRRLAQVL